MLAAILALSLVTMVGLTRYKLFAPVGSALVYLVLVFESVSLLGRLGHGVITLLIALFFDRMYYRSGFFLYLDDRRPLLGRLGKGLFGMGIVFDLHFHRVNTR